MPIDRDIVSRRGTPNTEEQIMCGDSVTKTCEVVVTSLYRQYVAQRQAGIPMGVCLTDEATRIMATVGADNIVHEHHKRDCESLDCEGCQEGT